jgi:DNA helicase-2/ATP-dependent DNA helicase PcrA
VLTTRIAWLLQTGAGVPGGVLAVTFTNKAAKEMMTRLSSMLPVNVRGMWIGTFHGLCNRFLRAHYKLANLPQAFQILDTQDQLSAIKRLMKQHGIDDERFPAKQTQWFISGCKEDGLRPTWSRRATRRRAARSRSTSSTKSSASARAWSTLAS